MVSRIVEEVPSDGGGSGEEAGSGAPRQREARGGNTNNMSNGESEVPVAERKRPPEELIREASSSRPLANGGSRPQEQSEGEPESVTVQLLQPRGALQFQNGASSTGGSEQTHLQQPPQPPTQPQRQADDGSYAAHQAKRAVKARREKEQARKREQDAQLQLRRAHQAELLRHQQLLAEEERRRERDAKRRQHAQAMGGNFGQPNGNRPRGGKQLGVTGAPGGGKQLCIRRWNNGGYSTDEADENGSSDGGARDAHQAAEDTAPGNMRPAPNHQPTPGADGERRESNAEHLSTVNNGGTADTPGLSGVWDRVQAHDRQRIEPSNGESVGGENAAPSATNTWYGGTANTSTLGRPLDELGRDQSDRGRERAVQVQRRDDQRAEQGSEQRRDTEQRNGKNARRKERIRAAGGQVRRASAERRRAEADARRQREEEEDRRRMEDLRNVSGARTSIEQGNDGEGDLDINGDGATPGLSEMWDQVQAHEGQRVEPSNGEGVDGGNVAPSATGASDQTDTSNTTSIAESPVVIARTANIHRPTERWSESRIDATSSLPQLRGIRHRLKMLLERVDGKIETEQVKRALEGHAVGEASNDNGDRGEVEACCPLCLSTAASADELGVGTCDLCDQPNCCKFCRAVCQTCQRSCCMDCSTLCTACRDGALCNDCGNTAGLCRRCSDGDLGPDEGARKRPVDASETPSTNSSKRRRSQPRAVNPDAWPQNSEMVAPAPGPQHPALNARQSADTATENVPPIGTANAMSILPGTTPIQRTTKHDVICGGGGCRNQGNVRFRQIVDSFKQAYCSTNREAERANIAAKVVASVRSSNPPARFLKETEAANCWLEVGDDAARAKAMQALRDAFRKENGRPTQRTSNIPPREVNGASPTLPGDTLIRRTTVHQCILPGITPIQRTTGHDVLSGRGGSTNWHPGNVRFRQLVDTFKQAWCSTKQQADKDNIAAKIVASVRGLIPPGRFLTEAGANSWLEVGDVAACAKVIRCMQHALSEEKAASIYITSPNAHDVVLDQGLAVPGNKYFFEQIALHRQPFINARPAERTTIAAKVVETIRELVPPGRFLEAVGPNMWLKIGGEAAINRVIQALGEVRPRSPAPPLAPVAYDLEQNTNAVGAHVPRGTVGTTHPPLLDRPLTPPTAPVYQPPTGPMHQPAQGPGYQPHPGPFYQHPPASVHYPPHDCDMAAAPPNVNGRAYPAVAPPLVAQYHPPNNAAPGMRVSPIMVPDPLQNAGAGPIQNFRHHAEPAPAHQQRNVAAANEVGPEQQLQIPPPLNHARHRFTLPIAGNMGFSIRQDENNSAITRICDIHRRSHAGCKNSAAKLYGLCEDDILVPPTQRAQPSHSRLTREWFLGKCQESRRQKRPLSFHVFRPFESDGSINQIMQKMFPTPADLQGINYSIHRYVVHEVGGQEVGFTLSRKTFDSADPPLDLTMVSEVQPNSPADVKYGIRPNDVICRLMKEGRKLDGVYDWLESKMQRKGDNSVGPVLFEVMRVRKIRPGERSLFDELEQRESASEQPQHAAMQSTANGSAPGQTDHALPDERRPDLILQNELVDLTGSDVEEEQLVRTPERSQAEKQVESTVQQQRQQHHETLVSPHEDVPGILDSHMESTQQQQEPQIDAPPDDATQSSNGSRSDKQEQSLSVEHKSGSPESVPGSLLLPSQGNEHGGEDTTEGPSSQLADEQKTPRIAAASEQASDDAAQQPTSETAQHVPDEEEGDAHPSGHVYPVGTKVSKIFEDPDDGVRRPFSGKVAAYDEKEQLYKIVYEDDDVEEIMLEELEEILVHKRKKGHQKSKGIELTGTLSYSDEDGKQRHIIEGTWMDRKTSPQHFQLVRKLSSDEDVKVLPMSGVFEGLFVQEYEVGYLKLKMRDIVQESRVRVSFIEKETDGKFSIKGEGTNRYGTFELRGTATRRDDGPEFDVRMKKRYPPSAAGAAEPIVASESPVDNGALKEGGLPAPTKMYQTGVVALRGRITTPPDSRCDGTVVATQKISGLWAPSLEGIMADPENVQGLLNKFAYELKKPQRGGSYLDGVYTGTGWFDMDGKRIQEPEIALHFQENSEGYHNIDGSGRNEFGPYKITGTSRDGLVTMFRSFAT